MCAPQIIRLNQLRFSWKMQLYGAILTACWFRVIVSVFWSCLPPFFSCSCRLRHTHTHARTRAHTHIRTQNRVFLAPPFLAGSAGRFGWPAGILFLLQLQQEGKGAQPNDWEMGDTGSNVWPEVTLVMWPRSHLFMKNGHGVGKHQKWQQDKYPYRTPQPNIKKKKKNEIYKHVLKNLIYINPVRKLWLRYIVLIFLFTLQITGTTNLPSEFIF